MMNSYLGKRRINLFTIWPDKNDLLNLIESTLTLHIARWNCQTPWLTLFQTILHHVMTSGNLDSKFFVFTYEKQTNKLLCKSAVLQQKIWCILPVYFQEFLFLEWHGSIIFKLQRGNAMFLLYFYECCFLPTHTCPTTVSAEEMLRFAFFYQQRIETYIDRLTSVVREKDKTMLVLSFVCFDKKV
jgi:hypothetical protein